MEKLAEGLVKVIFSDKAVIKAYLLRPEPDVNIFDDAAINRGQWRRYDILYSRTEAILEGACKRMGWTMNAACRAILARSLRETTEKEIPEFSFLRK